MTTTLIDIGNERGVILPQPIIQQAGLEGPLTLEDGGDYIIIRSVRKHPREGWEEVAAKLPASEAYQSEVIADWDCTLLDFHGSWEW